MSRSVDERVVKMEFDNKQFESNVSQSMSTLDKLKNSLDLLGTGGQLANLGKNIDTTGIDGLGTAVSKVHEKFSVLETIAVGALLKIGSQAVELGEKMVKSLTVDQIAAGWDKYADKIQYTQTMMSATREEFKDSEDQMAEVSQRLDKLNWFSDETSYSFLDMASNVAKFTNNGVKLDDAVEALQGVSTWAALSGANVQQASHAMYNLSQAMGVGAVTLADWKSIENAQMATMEFKQLAIDTAVAMGTLKEGEETVETFRENLTKGKWFTGEVLTETLKKYGSFASELRDFSENLDSDYYGTTAALMKDLQRYADGYYSSEDGLTKFKQLADNLNMSVEELTENFDHLTSSEYELGRRAFKAAQETKTFKEVIDATKDTASTAWMNIFENIIGNYEEAKQVWSWLVDEVWDVFVSPIDNLSTLTYEWKELGGRDLLLGLDDEDNLGAMINLWNSFKGTLDLVKEAFADIFPPMTAERLYDLTEKFQEFTKNLEWTEEGAELFKTVLHGAFTVIKVPIDAVVGALKLVRDGIGFVIESAVNLVKSFTNNGGVIYIADAFKNIVGHFSALEGVATRTIQKLLPSQDQVREVLDKIGLKLTTIAALVDVFTSKIRTMDNQDLRNFATTIKGIWAIFDTVREVIFQIVRGIADAFVGTDIDALAGGFVSIRSTLLDVTAAIANFFIGINNWLKETDIVKNAVEGIATAISWVITGVSNLFQMVTGVSIGDAFSNLLGIVQNVATAISDLFSKKQDDSGITDSVDRVAKKLNPIELAFKGFKKIAEALGKLFDMLKPALQTIGELIGTAFDRLGDFLINVVKNIDIKKLSGLFQIIEGFKFNKSITGVFDAISERLGGSKKESPFEQLKNLVKNISDFFEGLTKAIGEFQKSIKIANLLTIALAIGILTMSISTLAGIEPERIRSSLGALTVEFAELIGSLELITKTMGDANGKNLKNIGVAMIEIAAAIFILSKAFKSIAELDSDQITRGLLGIGGLLAEISAAMIALTNFSGEKQMAGALSVIGLAFAVKILAGAMKDIGDLEWEEIGKGMTGIAGILASIAVFNIAISKFGEGKGFTGVATAVVLIAAGVKIMASALEDLASMSWGEMIQGLVGMAAVLAAVAGFNIALDKLGDAGSMMKTAGAVLILSGAMVIMAEAIKIMGDLAFWDWVQGLLGFAGALAAVVVAMVALENTKGTMTSAASLLIVANAMVIMGGAMAIIGSLNFGDLVVGMIGFAGGLAAMVLALQAVSKIGDPVKSAAAMVVMASAIAIMAPALFLLGQLDAGGVAAALITLGGALAVMAVAAQLCQPMIPVMMALAGVVALIGVGAAAAGVGMLAFGAGLGAIAAAGEGAISLLVVAIDAFLALFPKIVRTVAETVKEIAKAVGDFILGLVTFLGDSAGTIAEAVIKIVRACIDVFMQSVPYFTEQAIIVIDSLLKTLAEHGPSIVESVLLLFESLMTSLHEHLPRIVQLFLDTILEVLHLFRDRLPDFIQTGIDIVLSLINGLAQGIRDNTEAVREAFLNLFSAVLESILGFLGIHSPSTVFAEMGMNMLQGLIDGALSMAENLWESFRGLMSGAIDRVKEKAGDFINAGKDLVSGLKDGIMSAASSVAEAARNLASDAIDSAKNALDSHSPSRVFMEIGKNVDEGFALGLTNNAAIVSNASDEVGNNAIAAMKDLLSGLDGQIIDDMDISPVITPVLDLTDVEAGAGAINGLLGDREIAIGSDAASVGYYGYQRQNSTLEALQALAASLGGDGRPNVVVNVYAADGMDETQIANNVIDRLEVMYARRREAWA